MEGVGPASRGGDFGVFLIPFAPGNADPTATTVGIRDGQSLIWKDGSTWKLSTFIAAAGGWKTLSYA